MILKEMKSGCKALIAKGMSLVFQRIFMLLGLLFPLLMSAQIASLKIEDQSSCFGESVYVNLLPNDLDSLGAITLYIDYVPNDLIFDTLIVLHPAFASLIYHDMEDENGNPIGRVGISWSGLTPVNPGTAAMVSLGFKYQGIPTTLVFNPASEIADWEAQVLNVNYLAGTVSNVYEPLIISQPAPEILAWTELNLEIVATPADSFQWQYLDGEVWINMTDGALVGGANAPTLFLYYGALGGVDRKIRCLIHACVTLISSEIQIYWMISSPQSIETHPLDLQFDPIHNRLQVDINETGNTGNYLLEILSLNAKSHRKINLNHSSTFCLNDLSSGIYLLILRKSGSKKALITKKIIISH